VPVIGRTAVIVIVVLLGSLSVYTSSDDGASEVSGAAEGAADEGAAEEGAGDVPLVWAHPAKSPNTNTNAISNLGNDFLSITLIYLLFICCHSHLIPFLS
jgi:hypothetical protein